jgi:RHS repeat-associated protein
LLPPDLKVDPATDQGRLAGAAVPHQPANPSRKRAAGNRPAALDNPPRASNLVLLPGLVVGDTSLQLYFDAPAEGWTQGTISLFAEGDLGNPLHTASFSPGQLTVCDSPARYCWTLHNSDGWGLEAGKRYVTTVTLTTADGQSTESDPSRAVAARALPVPPPLPAEQVKGPAGAASASTGAQAVLRGYGVNVATGAFTTRTVDATMASAYDVNVSALRTYSSANTTAGLLGPGWQFGYEARVHPKADSSDSVVFVDENGVESTYTRAADGSYTPPPGIRSTLTAKSGGGWEVVTPAQQRLAFDANGKLLSIRNARGKGVTVGYDAAGRLSSVTDAGGRVLTVTTQDPGRISTVKLPDGRTTTYSYTDGRLTAVRDPDGAVTKYGYDAAGRLTTTTDPLGHRQLMTTYDATSGRVTSQQDVFGKTFTFAWYPAEQLSKVTDPDGVVVEDGFKDNVLLFSRNGNVDTQIYRYDSKLNRQVTAEPIGQQVESTFDAAGNLTSQTVLSGDEPVTATATYDAANNLRSRTDAQGKQLTFTYNEFNQPLTGTDGEGHVTTFTYHDDSGLLATVTDPLDHVTRSDYDQAGNPSSITDPTGAKVTFAFDATGRLKSTVDPRGNTAGANPKTYTTTYDVYDGQDRLRRMTDPLGHFQLWDYDAAGRLTRYTDPDANPTSYVYDNANRVKTLIDADLRTTGYTYTDGGRLKTVTNGVGDVLTYTYDAAGRFAAKIAPRGKAPGANPADFTTTYGYDFNGNLTSVKHPYPGGGTVETRYTYDPRDLVTSVTDGLGNTTRYGYDRAGNRTNVTDPLGHTTTQGYDGNNRVTSFTDALGKTTLFAYDAAGNPKSETSPTGDKTTYGYDTADRLISLTSPRGNAAGADPAAFTTRFGYDVAGHATTSTDPLGHVTTVDYDPAGRVTRQVDPNGHATRYGYDNANRLTRIWGPDATNDTQVTVNNYDHAGNLIDRTNPLGFVDRYTYDAAGRLKTTIDAIGNRRELTYDPDGNIATIVTARGTSSGSQAGRDAGTIVQRYDILDRLAERDLGTGPTYSYGYDGASRLTSLADPTGEQIRGYDAGGYLKTVTRSGSTFGYGYNANGDLTSRTLPDGSQQTLTYDDDGRPATQTTAVGQTGYSYDPDGDLTQITQPGGGTDTRTYDNAGRLATLAVNGPNNSPITAYTVTRDKVGNPTRLDTTIGATKRSDAFTYDAADRVTAMCYQAASCSGAPRTLSFSYDLVGNRLTRTKIGSGGFTERYSYNAADQLSYRSGGPDGTVTYDYDQDGNTTRAGKVASTYDLDNKVTNVSDGAHKSTYTTDAAGNRLSADTSPAGGGTASRTDYQWDVNNPLAMLVSEQTPGATRTYTYNPDGSPATQQAGATASILHADPFGNTTALTDPSGTVQQRYTLSDPFGGLDPVVTGGPDTRLSFQGQYKDPLSGTYHMRARDYASTPGRFQSVDPLSNRIDTPATSSYVYAADNPMTGSDPSGLCFLFDLQCQITQTVVNVAMYEMTQHPTDKQREDQFGFGVLRAIPDTIDATWNSVVDITNFNKKLNGQPTIPDSAKLHLTQSYDKFVGTHFGVDTSSPYYTGGDTAGQIAMLFIPVGGEEAGGAELLTKLFSKFRLPEWFPKDVPHPVDVPHDPHLPGGDPHVPSGDPHAPADPHTPPDAGGPGDAGGTTGDPGGAGDPHVPDGDPQTGTGAGGEPQKPGAGDGSTPSQPKVQQGSGKGRRGTHATRNQLDDIRDDFLAANPGWTHAGGGRDVVTGLPRPEVHFGPTKGPGGRFADLSFSGPGGVRIHIQTVTTYRSGLPIIDEVEAALDISRLSGEIVIMIPKR